MANKSFKKLREDASALAKKHLPTHASDAAAELPEKLPAKESSESDKSKSLLPTHASDAAAEVPDSLEGKVGKRAVKPELDGQAVADKSGKHGNAEGKELPEAEDKEDEEKDELEEDLKDLESNIDAALSEEDEKEEEKEEGKEEKKEGDKEEKKDKDLEEHLAALTSGETLSEEFIKKAETIFEAAVKARVEKKVSIERSRLREAYKKVSRETIKNIHEKLVNQVNDYLDHIVESWLKDNELAVETGLKAEIAEQFMLSLRDLLKEHFVEVPESKKDLVKEQAETIAQLQKELNDEVKAAVELKKKLGEAAKEEVIKTLCEGLTALDAEKFRSLIKSISFDTKPEYEEKLCVIKESYFPKKASASVEGTDIIVEGGLSSGQSNESRNEMDVYADAISRSVKK